MSLSSELEANQVVEYPATMPALTNPRHERFARAFIRIGIASEAFRKAGYKSDSPASVWTCSSRLLRHAHVQRRIKELKKQMATRNRITVDSLLSDLALDRALARSLGQPSAAIAATQLAAKLCGLLVDRKESGAPGEFSGLQSADDVLALMRSEFGDAAADALGAVLVADAAAAEPAPAEPAEPVLVASREPGDALN